ncbi:unnamed protein product [marine sediment metagenome]|uniref:Uncharacterized protein n=1 Tax=marine sediment metagenome TaxID=412755 RepID=X1SNF9_9ZZZZ
MDLITIILNAISPELRKLIVQFILSLRAAAKKTSNPLDDIFVEILIKIFGIKE